ncbi:MAG: type II toxin-antitoxin system RelE/ParE family toxin [Thiobacillus sp.]
MPLVRHLEGDIWEVRIRLDNTIARVLFTLEGSMMLLQHGFIKKQQATPKPDLNLAKNRLKQREANRSWASRTSAAALTTSCNRKPYWKR